ncbi:MAG: IS110 family transposase [Flavobacteriales bacterium]|nr:IS110 family transposase [Flavobacteriales bacterium]
MVRNQRQLTKYAGLDVEKHDSGTSVHKPGRLSKKGNRHIRKALYMPALSRIRSEAKSKEFFKRLVSKRREDSRRRCPAQNACHTCGRTTPPMTSSTRPAQAAKKGAPAP